MVGGIDFIIFIVLMLCGIPVSLSMGVATGVCLTAIGVSSEMLCQKIITGIESWQLLAVPFFITAAQIMNAGELTSDLFDFADKVVGWVKGGLAHANVLASMIFAGISGAAVADAAGLGTVEIKAMKDAGYGKRLAVAVTASSCLIGPIIPPSIMLIIYGHITELSIAALWIAGIIPGVITGIILMIYVYFVVSIGMFKAPKPHRFSLHELYKSFIRNLPILFLPSLLLILLLTGWATPVEIGVVACLYSFVLSVVYRGKKFLKKLPQTLKESVKSTAIIMFIVGTATAFTWIITREQTAVVVYNLFISFTSHKYLLILMVNAFLLLVGALMEGIPAMLIIVPLLSPLASTLGVNPLQFGVMVVFNLMIGMLTPPMGVGLYIMKSITDLPMKDIVISCAKFYLPLIIALLLITFVPLLSTFLPKVVGLIQ